MAALEPNVHEHIARAMYYISIHLLFGSLVACAAWVLTALPRTSSTQKYWIWVVTALNFVVPVAAITDKLWAGHFTWAAPLGAIGGPIWDVTQGRPAMALAAIWATGASAMLLRLLWRLRLERRDDQAADSNLRPGFLVEGIPVSFAVRFSVPAVHGILHPRILLPAGMDRALTWKEFNAVLLHEAAHAKRRDNLIRLLYEVSLCVLWFHPLVWLAGARMALYRELSCDESVLRRAAGHALISALAKLAVPERASFLHATASSHLSYRLHHLGGTVPPNRVAGVLTGSLFATLLAAGIFGTISHTACCFAVRSLHPACSRAVHN